MDKQNLSLQEKAQALGRAHKTIKSGGNKVGVRVRGCGLKVESKMKIERW